MHSRLTTETFLQAPPSVQKISQDLPPQHRTPPNVRRFQVLAPTRPLNPRQRVPRRKSRARSLSIGPPHLPISSCQEPTVPSQTASKCHPPHPSPSTTDTARMSPARLRPRLPNLSPSRERRRTSRCRIRRLGSADRDGAGSGSRGSRG